MDNSYPAKLELISMQLKEPIEQQIHGEISLTKGTHHFGGIPFFLEKGQTKFVFDNPNILSFFYTPRTTTRRDIIFRINLIDLTSDENIGDIEVSTHELNQIFSKNRKQIISKSQQIAEGVHLVYKIYQPKIEVFKTQQKIGFRTVKGDDLINTIFARPQAKPRNRKIQPPQPSNPILPLLGNLAETKKSEQKKEIVIDGKQEQKNKKGKLLKKASIDIANIFLGLKKKDVSNDENQKQKSEGSGSSNNKRSEEGDNFLIDLGLKKSQKSVASEDADELMEGLLGHLKQSHSSSVRKKHTLMPAHEQDHHSSKKLSIKLRVVIFLLIFGILMLFYDTITDRSGKNSQIQQPQNVQKPKKKTKSKKKKIQSNAL